MDEEKIGTITHYFGKIGVGVVRVEAGGLKIGDKIKVKSKEGKDKVEQQEVNSMQVEHKAVQGAKKGEEVGLKLENEVREGDVVYRVGE